MNLPKTIEQKLNEGRQYRQMVNIEVRTEEDGAKIVQGYATTFNQPYELWREKRNGREFIVYEQVEPTAFDDVDMSDVIMQYDHEGRVFARSSNGTLALLPDGNGLQVRADLGGTEIGRQLYEEIAGGYTNKMSFGFRVEHDTRNSKQNEDGSVSILRTIDTISKLYDVSAVSRPANDATSISARSFSEGVIEEAMQELLAQEERERQKQKQKQKIRILTEVQNGN